MVYRKNDEDVPPRMLDLLRMFLAASSRGEHTVLVLESRKSAISIDVLRIWQEFLPPPALLQMVLGRK